MYCYQIINKVNQKKYIGITKDFKRRMKQHCSGYTDSIISRAIKKYKKENFIFEIIASGLSIEEAEELERKLIREEKTLAPDGYNLAKGGLHGGTRSKISDEQIQYIKDNRDKPEYLLYDEFSEIICYGYFKQIYHNYIRKDIIPKVEMYPYNLQFSCQFTRTKLEYDDIVEIRKAYASHLEWDKVYEDYKNKVAKSTFWDVWIGRSFSLIMPEIFTPENKKILSRLSHTGEKNGKSKLKEKDVLEIRRKFSEEQLAVKQIHFFYPQVSLSTIQDIISRRTWKNI